LGYQDKAWRLPEAWRDVQRVDLFAITTDGLRPLSQNLPVTGGKVILSLDKDQAVTISPAGIAPRNTVGR
jgi:hypothetical protein